MNTTHAVRGWATQSPCVAIEAAQPSDKRSKWNFPTVGNVFVRLPSGNLLLLAERQAITNQIGDAGKPIYLWNGHRCMHLNGATHEFVLYNSSKYNGLKV